MSAKLKVAPEVDLGDLEELAAAWLSRYEDAVANGRRSQRTVDGYREGVGKLVAFLRRTGRPLVAAELTREDIAAYVDDLRTTPKANGELPSLNGVSVRFRSLVPLFKYLKAEQLIGRNPMEGMLAPREEKDRPIPSPEDIARLVATCERNTFDGKRDRAVLLLAYSTGTRLSGLAGIRVDDIDDNRAHVRIVSKGRERYTVPVTGNVREALILYLAARKRHRHAARPELWLSSRNGAFTAAGIQIMARRRARRAGLVGFHFHQLRRAFADHSLANGADPLWVQEIANWKDPTMLRHYIKEHRAQLAAKAHETFNPARGL